MTLTEEKPVPVLTAGDDLPAGEPVPLAALIREMGTELAVRHGAALLDRAMPGWRSAITVSRLDLLDLEECVLGQLYGSYGTGMTALFGTAATSENACLHGFDLPEADYRDWSDDDRDRLYAPLNQLWRDVIGPCP